MKFSIKYILIFLSFIFSSINVYSQQSVAEIELIHFNSSATYASGSGVSIHINPKGIYSTNNQFILELSDTGGAFNGNTEVLSTISDLYTPIINGVIPENTPAGNYNLRIRATNGYTSTEVIDDPFTELTYGEYTSPSYAIEISDQSVTYSLELSNTTPNDGGEFFNCISTDGVYNPSIGSVKASDDDFSDQFSSLQIIIGNSTADTISVTLFDILNDTSTTIGTSIIGGVGTSFSIPDDLPIGTYTFEIAETFDSGDSEYLSIYSFSFLWHTNTKTFANSDNETICVGTEIGFTVETNFNGVGSNYMGSYYELDFGDGSTVIFSQAYVLVSNEFTHTYTDASCNQDDSNIFEVSKGLYNKLNCDVGAPLDVYLPNGSPIATPFNASVPPTSDFDIDDQYCMNPETQQNLIVLNQSELGEWGPSNSVDCFDDIKFKWYVQRPIDTGFIEISDAVFGSWLDDIGGGLNGEIDGLLDLSIPYNDVVDGGAGCWNFRLNAENDGGGNSAACNSGVFAEGVIEVLDVPDPSFLIQDSNGNVIPGTPPQICPNSTINLIDTSNLDPNDECQDPSYSWSISPSNGYSYSNGTSSSTQNPSVTFNSPGIIYTIELTLDNGVCDSVSVSQELIVEGEPSVEFNPNSHQECLDDISNSNPYQIDFSQSFTPTYSQEPFLPSTYLWEIEVDDVPADNNDYSFVGGTTSASDFPIIEFYDFKCYTITANVDGDCDTSNNAEFTLSIDQNPIANFEILNSSGEVVDEICPGEIVQLNDLSEVSGEGCQDLVYLWGISTLTPGINTENHCVPVAQDTWSTPSPYVEFTEPGVFEIELQVTAGACPVGTYTDTIVVEGPPSVSIQVDGLSSDEICLDNISNTAPTQINFNEEPYRPVYSSDSGTDDDGDTYVYNAPDTYLWEIEVDGVPADNNDYSFVEGTTSASAFPIIDFYSFGDYTITTTATGDCGEFDDNTFVYSINEIPSITNPDSDLQQTICAGESTQEIEFTSSVPNTTFTWSFVSADTYLSGYDSSTNTGNFTVQPINNSNNITGQVIFEVTPSTADCDGSPRLITITVNPTPDIDDVSEAICTGGTFTTVEPQDGNGQIVPSDTTYTWTVSGDGVVTGGSANTTGSSTIPGQELVNSTSSPATLTYNVTATSAGDCTGTFDIIITVNPTPVIDDVSEAICTGGTFTTVEPQDGNGQIVPSGTTYTWDIDPNSSSSITGGSANTTGSSTIPGQQLVNSTSSPATLTYNVTATSEGCIGTFDITITVNPTPVIDNVTEAICTGGTFDDVLPVDGFNGQIVPSGTTYTWDIDPNSSSSITGGSANTTGSSTIPGQQLVNSTSSPATLTYNVTATSAEGCTGTFDIVITVNPLGQVTQPDDIVVCNQEETTIDFETLNSGGATSYTWVVTGDAVGLSSSTSSVVDSTEDITFTATNSGDQPISAEVTVTPIFEDCSGTPQPFTITVNPTTNIVGFDDQYIFTGGTTTAVALSSTTAGATFSWTAVAQTGITGLTTTEGLTNQIPEETLYNDTDGPLNVVYTIIPSPPGDAECPGTEYTYTVIVNPVVGMASVESQTVCNGDLTSQVVFESINQGGTTSFTWSVTGDDIGLTATDDGTGIIDPFTAINNTSSPLVATFSVIPTFENGGVSNTGTPVPFTITVNPTPVIDDVSEAICTGGTFTTVEPQDGNGQIVPSGTTYTWDIDPNSSSSITGGSANTTGSSTIPGQQLVNSTSSPATLTYNVTATSEGCIGTFDITITVNSTPVIDNVTETICTGGTFTTVDPQDGNGQIVPSGTTYTWDIDPNSSSSITGGSANTTGSSTILGSELTLAAGTATPQNLIYTVTPTSAEGCVGDTFDITITVNPTPVIDNVSETICSFGTFTTVDPQDGNGQIVPSGTTYTWDIDPNSSSSITGGSANTTGSSTIPGQQLVNSTSSPATLTYNVTATSEGCIGTFDITITVNPTPVIDNVTEAICTGGTFDDVLPVDGFNGQIVPSGTTYTWDIDPNSSSSITGGSANTTGSSTIPGQQLVNSTSSPATLTYNVTATSAEGCTGTFDIVITVNPLGQVTQPDDIVVCNQEETTIDFETLNSGGATSYTWVVTGDAVGLSSSTSSVVDSINDITFTAVNETTDTLTATIAVTPIFEGCTGPSKQFSITVNPTAQVDPVNSIVICHGQEVLDDDILFSTENTNGTTIYNWENSNDYIGLDSSGTGDIDSFIAFNETNEPVTATIIVTPSYDDPLLLCTGEPILFTITVNPLGQVNQPDDIVVCNQELTTIDFETLNSGGATSYTWVVTGDAVGLSSSTSSVVDSTEDITFTAVNETTDTLTATIEVTPIFEGCSGTPQPFTITVNPTAQVEPVNSIVICHGQEVSDILFSTENTNGTTIYSWDNSNDYIGLDSSGTGDIDSFIAFNETNEPVIATITVTPSYDDPLLLCTGTSESFTITVNPSAQVNQPDDITLCNGIDSSIIEFTTLNEGGETYYTWTNNNPSIGLDADGADFVPVFIPINNTTQPIEAIITVTPLFTGDIVDCPGVSQQFIITVNPSAQVIDPEDVVVCNQELTTIDFQTNNTLGSTSYTWSSSIDIGAGLNGDNNMEFISSNPAEQPVIATITVTPQFENEGIICDGASETFIITVNGNVDPKPIISNYNSFEISCFGANDGFIELSPIGATPFETEPSYIYQWIGPNGFNSTDQDIYNLEPGTYSLSVTDSLNCVFEFEYEIEEPEPLTINVDLEQDIECNGVLSGEIQITPNGGASPYTYEWTKDGQPFSSEEDISNLGPGNYILILNDSNQCGPVTSFFEITEPTPIETTLDSQVDILCFGENTGSLEVSASGGSPTILSDGSSQYNYLWNGPNGYTSTDEDIYDLFAGIYILTVSDSFGCEFTFDYELTQPEDLIINYTTTDNSCYQSNDGSITLDIVGGVEPYDIYWSNFGNGPVQTNLDAGIYEVTVIDAHECEEVVNIEIIEAPLFDIDPIQTNISCFGANDGSIILNIEGGVEPITVTWDDDPTSGDERYNLGPGTYNVLIEDSSGNNCTITQSFIIIEPQEIVLNGVVENPLDCDNVNSGSIDLQVVGGTEPYSFLWSNGETTEDLFNIPAGSYSVTVTDFMECEAITQFDLYRPSDIESELEIEFIADCENAIPYQISTVVVSGGVPPYNITWSDGEVSGENNEIMTTSQNGTVIVDIVDSLGCADQIIFDVDLFEIGEPGFEYTSSGLTECETIGVGDEIFFTNTSTGDYTNLIWSFDDPSFPVEGEENPTHIYNQTGIYEVTLTVEYPYGCTYEYSETIEVTNGYGLVLPNTFTPNGDGLNDTIRPWYNCMNFIEISIYDTFGSLLYVESSTDEIYGWDGTINGKEAENGNYIIVVKAITFAGEEIEINGPVALIR